MILHRSKFIHLLELAPNSVLVIHAVTQMRISITREVEALIKWFDEPQDLEASVPALAARFGADEATVRTCLETLIDRAILTEQPPAAELAALANELRGRDPEAILDHYRRARMEGSHPYWAVRTSHTLTQATTLSRRLDVLLLGDCDLQMEADFLRAEASSRSIDLRAAASFAADTELARDRHHDAIIIGALQARHAIVLGNPEHHNGDPARVYVQAMESVVAKLRARTAAPILIDGLPEPTVQPLGFADRGIHSHRNRFRTTNLALARMAEQFADVHLVDVAAALAAAGARRLLDDGLVSFTHFGSPGWMLQRPASEWPPCTISFPTSRRWRDQSPAIRIGGRP